ncbi:MAG: ABC transporter ATP-binding protein [Pseudomonadota bacterium]
MLIQPDRKNSQQQKPPEDRPLIEIRSVTKVFDQAPVVNALDLDVYAGELFAILGGSGCGKTTLLRMLAGFETPTSGQIFIDGEDMAGLPPYERPVNMMFQSYAVFPHMSVGRNVAYGLVKEGVPSAEISDRVDEMLERVQLLKFKSRRPDQLSGGQLQRVALARALIKRPKVLLLDEPLAALDKKLREATQFELINLQKELGTTFIVVTHDQEEAMTLATRIAVMREGQFVQTGTPTEVYEFPCNRFVAEFFGTTNVISGTVASATGSETLLHTDDLGLLTVSNAGAPNLTMGTGAMLAIRPEKIEIATSPPPHGQSLHGVIWDLGYYGNHTVYRVKISDSDLILQVTGQNSQRAAQRTLEVAQEVHLSWSQDDCILLTE